MGINLSTELIVKIGGQLLLGGIVLLYVCGTILHGGIAAFIAMTNINPTLLVAAFIFIIIACIVWKYIRNPLQLHNDVELNPIEEGHAELNEVELNPIDVSEGGALHTEFIKLATAVGAELNPVNAMHNEVEANPIKVSQ